MPQEGTLDIRLDVASFLLETNLTVEIQDANLRLVKRLANPRKAKVPAGLYRVSAVLTDGRRHSQNVILAGGETAVVQLRAQPTEHVDGPPVDEAHKVPATSRKQFMTRSESIPERGEERDVRLVEAEHVELWRTSGWKWLFIPKVEPERVPTATFEYRERRWTVSLPVNPCGYGKEAACAVRTFPTKGALEVRAWFTPERTVSSTLQHMLATHRLMSAADVARKATRLLCGKYKDPTGAALGAVVLHKMDALGEYEGWLKNLADDFAWLPDGRVLLASFRARKEATRDDALEMLLQQSGKQMMFTECLSMAVDLLRRWPGGARKGDRAAARRALGQITTRTDWEATTVTFEHRRD